MKKSFLALAVVAVLCALGGPTFASEAATVFDPVADGVSAPTLIASSRVTPSYPPAALHARYDATVVARAIVNEDGTVDTVEVMESSRAKLGFEKSVIAAVKQWRFEPAQRQGENVASYAWMRLYFNPPQAGSNGFVAADFPPSMMRDEQRWVATSHVAGGADATGVLTAAGGPNKSAMAGDQAQRFATYGKPPICKGCLYDRTTLIPASTYKYSSPIGGE